MQTCFLNTFLSLHNEGALLLTDLLQRILISDKDQGRLATAE